MMSENEETEILDIANRITHMVRLEGRWLSKLPGCVRHTIYPRLSKDKWTNYTGEIQSSVHHDMERANHFKRLRGFNA